MKIGLFAGDELLSIYTHDNDGYLEAITDARLLFDHNDLMAEIKIYDASDTELYGEPLFDNERR